MNREEHYSTLETGFCDIRFLKNLWYSEHVAILYHHSMGATTTPHQHSSPLTSKAYVRFYVLSVGPNKLPLLVLDFALDRYNYLQLCKLAIC